MPDTQTSVGVNTPHDKLFREILSDLNNARSFLQHHLQKDVRSLIDLNSLAICKDSFIEKELADYYSDMLYTLKLAGAPGFVYVLFEHKSWHDKYVHLKLLEYMVKIWRLFLKQQPENQTKDLLPVIIPLLICHGDGRWPPERAQFTSLLAGPVDRLACYIPDFRYELYDLRGLPDEEIKGAIMLRVVLLLFKYSHDPHLMQRLPGILALMGELLQHQTGLQYLEVVLRYLFSIAKDITSAGLKEVVEKAFTEREGEYVMTLAEKLHDEGKIEGKIEGLIEAIELGMSLKFPDQVHVVMSGIQQVKDIELLRKIKDTIKFARNDTEVLALIQ